ncbi:hypothetical protein QQ045_031766 [Rhodiola kirilowii]
MITKKLQGNKNEKNETEVDGKEKDQPKEKENVEEQPTADEVALHEDEQAQPDRILNKLKDNEEEKNEKDQAKENETIQEIETATEVIVLEDKQGEQLKHLQSEDQEAETSAPGVNDDEIDIPKNEADTEIDQAKDEDAKEIETTTEVFELESKAVELEHLQQRVEKLNPAAKMRGTPF